MKKIIFSIDNNSNKEKNQKCCNFQIKLNLKKITSDNITLVTWTYTTDILIQKEIVYNNLKKLFSILEVNMSKYCLIDYESITINKNIDSVWKYLLNYRILKKIKPMHFINVEYEGDNLEQGKRVEILFCNKDKITKCLKGEVIEIKDNSGYKKLEIKYEITESNTFIKRIVWILNVINDNTCLLSNIHYIKGNLIFRSKKRIVKELKKKIEEIEQFNE